MTDLEMLLTQKNVKEYHKASKQEKAKIINHYAFQCNVPRNTIAQRFRRAGRSPYPVALDTSKHRKKRGRHKIYKEIHKLFVKEVWNLAGCICAERVFPQLETYINILEPTSNFPIEVINTCKGISLGQLKAIIKEFPKPYYPHNTKRTSLFTDIPIDADFKRHTTTPGYMEVDFVEHNGGNSSGQYGITLSYVDVALGWHVRVAALGQSLAAMSKCHITASTRIYHQIRECHPDNNKALLSSLFSRAVLGEDTSRSRPYHKDDNGHVEQKNGDKIRKMVGYFRYDTVEQINLLNAYYQIEDTISNFFTSSYKLAKKVKLDNGRYRRVYHPPQTPYSRALQSKKITVQEKKNLEQVYQSLDLVSLRKQSNAIKEELAKVRGL